MRIETDFLESLKKRAAEEERSLSEFVRRMIKQPSKLDKIELRLEEIQKKIKQEVNQD